MPVDGMHSLGPEAEYQPTRSASAGIVTTGMVLCGGKSVRMGRPKALLPWKGRTLVEHIVEIMHGAVDEVIVVNSEDVELPPLDACIVTDRQPHLGPLGALREGLEIMKFDRAYVTGTDAPFLTVDLIHRLLGSPGCVAASVDGILQPLAAVYPRNLASMASHLIEYGRHGPVSLLHAGNVHAIPLSEASDRAAVRNLNDPSAYLQALRDDGQDGQVIIELPVLTRSQGALKNISTSPGVLADVIAQIERQVPHLRLRDGMQIDSRFRITINGRNSSRVMSIPVAPGERVCIFDVVGTA